MGFTKKLVFAYSIIILMFMAVLLGLAYRYIVDVSERTSLANQSQLLQKTSSQVESYLDELYKIGVQVSSDVRIINMFSDLQNDTGPENYFEYSIMDSIDIGSILASYNAPGYPVWRVSAYNQYGDYVSTGLDMQGLKYATVNDADTIAELMRELKGKAQAQNKVKIFASERQDAILRYTAILMPITNYYADEVYGIVEIQQSMDKLEKSIALDQLGDSTTVYLFDENMNQILPQKQSYDDLDKSKYYITSEALEHYGWNMVLALDRSSTVKPYQGILTYLILACVIVVLVLLSAVYLITKRITAPLVRLSESVRQTTLDNVPSYLDNYERVDEVRELSAAFNAMLERLNKSLAYEKRAYLLALQSQMDPHFLYNILAIISGMGAESGNDRIADICGKVSAIMRYNTTFGSGYVTLEDELNNAKDYLELMKLRYEDYFYYKIQVIDSLKPMKLPRQVLQPILENCFEHGFKAVPPPWNIEIAAGVEGGRWYIRVSDNGAGFQETEIEELKRKVDEYSKNLPDNYADLKIGGLGLINTILRLKLMWGDGIEYHVLRNRPKGTVIELREVKND